VGRRRVRLRAFGKLRSQASSDFLSAAWACDDSGAIEQARICRDRAAEMLARAIEWGDVPSESPVVHGVRADLLRRAGRHDEALAALDAVTASGADDDEPTQAATVLAYIRELAEAGDDEPHSVAEAFASGE
jgi:Arc/MetJ family transcription regulator